MIKNDCGNLGWKPCRCGQLDKTRKVAELDRTELDALVASVKVILKQDTVRVPSTQEVLLNARLLGILMPPAV